MGIPPLRFLDITPIEVEGERLFCLRDQEGYAEDAVILSPPALFIALQLNGVAEVCDIQAAFAAQAGCSLPAEDVGKVVEFLEARGLLESDTFERMRSRIASEFLDSPIRPAHFAGKTYPSDPVELRRYFNRMFETSGDARPPSRPAAAQSLPGLVVPHIDFLRGGAAYAQGYGTLREFSPPRRAIVFGVAHAAPPAPFILTRKHFDTPLGLVKTDEASVEQLASCCGFDLFAHEMAHRTEHSIEFHAAVLAYLFGEQVEIVPILCGPFGDGDRDAPDSLPEVVCFLEACAALYRDDPENTCVIASADLSHLGRRFGDDFDISDELLEAIRERDLGDLEGVLAADPRRWYDNVMRDKNQRRVCGLNCVYSTLMTLDRTITRGELIHYGAAPDPAGGVVSFASLALR